MDLNRPIILHETLGFGPNFVDLDRGLTNTTLVKEVIRKKINLENISEEMRVLYVALTRAKEKLIITGQVKDMEKSLKKWTELSAGEHVKILEGKVEKAGGYLDWIMSVLLKHKNFCAQRTDGKIYSLGDDVCVKLEIRSKKGILKDLSLNDAKPGGLFTLDTIKDETSAFEISQRLSHEYAFLDDTRKGSKISVTELKRLAQHMETEDIGDTLIKEETMERPAFLMKRTGLSAAEKGTAFHKVMQYIDFGRAGLDEIIMQLDGLVRDELIRKEEADAVDPMKVKKLLESDLGQRMAKADLENRLKREVKFLMNMEESEVMVIGVIDCYFEEDGKLILIDYKTDYVMSDDYTDVLVTRYREQLNYYKGALESITGLVTGEIYIYSVPNTREIQIF
ncbi:MAG TPA: hypothetical protein DHM90_09035 [Clostridiaceae bacterium]|nr:hypothetical protein [Clostridiaceae bacterium]